MTGTFNNYMIDEEIKKIIQDYEWEYLKKLSPLYKESIPNIIDEVLSANKLEDFINDLEKEVE